MLKTSTILIVLLLASTVGTTAAQSLPPRKDIPTIAKAANGAVASIIMSDKEGKLVSQGSGFLVTNDGLVVTNYHVIAEGTSAIVKFPDGAFYLVDGVVASDKVRDLAVIRAHGSNFQTLALGNSDRIQVGEDVVAIGNPLSLESTVSNGIVSGIRTGEALGGKFLQITTPISPGSSGGPLFNMEGEVVGITTMKLEGGENLNFAIPINDVKALIAPKLAAIHDFPNETEPPTDHTDSLPAVASPVPSPSWTGQFGGIVHNNTGGLSAQFVIIVNQASGVIRGCMAVQEPLFGSGPLIGRVEEPTVSFSVTSAIGRIIFVGQRNNMDVTGTYTVESAGLPNQLGNFTLHKTNDKGLATGFSTANCPTDAEIHK